MSQRRLKLVYENSNPNYKTEKLSSITFKMLRHSSSISSQPNVSGLVTKVQRLERVRPAAVAAVEAVVDKLLASCG